MPKFLVTKCVDAVVNYGAIVEAATAKEADEFAQENNDSLSWSQTGVYELDGVDFDNIEPQEVADDFTIEPAEDLAAELLAALKAIVARIQGEWDSPELMAVGPLGATDDDILHIAQTAIAKVGNR